VPGFLRSQLAPGDGAVPVRTESPTREIDPSALLHVSTCRARLRLRSSTNLTTSL
jgi:hypothetical protein